MKRELPIESNEDRDVVDRRDWTRYHSDLKRVVVLGQTSQVASIVDESFGGIGIIVRDIRGLSVNQPIKLLYSDAPMTGMIRRIGPASVNAFYVGVQWASASTNRQTAACPLVLRDSAHFIRLQQSLKLVCDLVGVDENDEVLSCVRLPSGSELCCPPEYVMTMSLRDRREELLAMGGDTTMLLGLYQLGERDTQESTIDAILNFEYSCHEK
jgi:hypothetical protein